MGSQLRKTGKANLRLVKRTPVDYSVPGHLALRLLQASLAFVMTGAGTDKWVGASQSWGQYIPAFVPWLMGLELPQFLTGVGLFEIFCALGLVFLPAVFGYVVCFWLLAATLSQLVAREFPALALLDLALAVAAFALGQLAQNAEILHRPLFKPTRFLPRVMHYPLFRGGRWRLAH